MPDEGGAVDRNVARPDPPPMAEHVGRKGGRNKRLDDCRDNLEGAGRVEIEEGRRREEVAVRLYAGMRHRVIAPEIVAAVLGKGGKRNRTDSDQRGYQQRLLHSPKYRRCHGTGWFIRSGRLCPGSAIPPGMARNSRRFRRFAGTPAR